jgi:hypothetical protein
MIANDAEVRVIKDLVAALDENIEACGRCDHSVGICFCHLAELRAEAVRVLVQTKASGTTEVQPTVKRYEVIRSRTDSKLVYAKNQAEAKAYAAGDEDFWFHKNTSYAVEEG